MTLAHVQSNATPQPTQNPVYRKFFRPNQPFYSAKYADEPQYAILKRRLHAELHFKESNVASTPIFCAKGNYLLAHAMLLRDQSAIHDSTYGRLSTRSAKLVNSVAPSFNKLMRLLLH